MFDYAAKAERLAEVNLELESPDVWNNKTKVNSLNKERTDLSNTIGSIDKITKIIADVLELIEMYEQEADEDLLIAATEDIAIVENELDMLEFKRMFSGEMDANNAYFDIQSGSGGTEAQDWAEMLLRMYLRWFEKKGFKSEILEVSNGDVAGIKGASVFVSGENAFGWLRTEIGVHRLVRKSPFDSGNRRHTSFAAVFVAPEIDDDIEININLADLRIDTYRSSGAGGQHVNTTDSAVRITHIPTNTVVACQNERSQHANKDRAMKMLKAKLYEQEVLKKREEANILEQSKSDIGWGSQIRSYVLDQSRIKDLRTGIENSNTVAVLDGDLDLFVETSLKQGL